MPGHEKFTSLEALPPSVGDAAVAAVLLRDVAASIEGRHGSVTAATVEVADASRFRIRAVAPTGSPADLDHAPLAAPELFDGAVPDARTDVYAAACLALTRYLGTSPTPTVALTIRATQRIRLAALRQAHRTMPARLGALPDPFRTVFAQAIAKEPHLRPTPARLVALLDAAFAAVGEHAEADARARVHRLIVLARVFEPAGAGGALKAPPTLTKIGALTEVAPTPLHLPLRSLPTLRRPTGVARGVLVVAVTVVATGAVVAAAVVGFGSSPTTPTPQAIATFPSPSSTSGPTVGPADGTSAPAPRATGTGTAAAAGGTLGNGGGSGNAVGYDDPGSGGSGGGAQYGNGGSGGSGSGSGGGSGGSTGGGGTGGTGGGGTGGGGTGGGGTGGGGGGSSTPKPPGSTPPSSTPPTSTPPSDPPTSEPPTSTPPSDPPTSEPPTSTPPTDSPSPTVVETPTASPTSSDSVPPTSSAHAG